VDVRVICACNKDLKTAVENGSFRTDLYYRLNGFPIEIPPLRKRPDDILLLAGHFLAKYGYAGALSFSDQAMAELQQFSWPGNVRELENTVRRAAIMAQSENRKLIRVKDLPAEIRMNKNIGGQNAGYISLEQQILHSLRTLKFSQSAISQTAKAFGNRDRGTITEYFRGICFEYLVRADFNLTEAARQIAATKDSEVLERVARKIQDYISNLRTDLQDGVSKNDSKSASPFKGLPKKYHESLNKVLSNLNTIKSGAQED
ncbi:MAG: sigma 54-interacting transcriptional regulator, partial [bacterium]